MTTDPATPSKAGSVETDGRWYIVHTYSGQEDRVQKNLEQRIETMDMGDKILEVEGKSTRGRTLNSIVRELKGKADTPVRMKVFRAGWRESREFTVKRRKVNLETVLYRMLPGKVGYVALTSFGEQTDEDLEEALGELVDGGMLCMILDLRNNSGGYLPTAIHVVDCNS